MHFPFGQVMKKKSPFFSTLSTQKSLAEAKSDHALPKCGCQIARAALDYHHNHHQVLEKRQCELVFIDLCAQVPKRFFEYSPLNCDLLATWANKRIYSTEPLTLSLLIGVTFERNTEQRPRSSKACSGMYVHA